MVMNVRIRATILVRKEMLRKGAIDNDDVDSILQV